MDFILDDFVNLKVSDTEISELLSQVYVDAGYTNATTAATLFNPEAVKQRGMIIAARETFTTKFAGMVILVPPASKAIMRAKDNECEMQLLAVKPEFRGNGLGRRLVARTIELALHNHWSKMILWTQVSMQAAQKLYETAGFQQTDTMTKNNITFLVYEKTI